MAVTDRAYIIGLTYQRAYDCLGDHIRRHLNSAGEIQISDAAVDVVCPSDKSTEVGIACQVGFIDVHVANMITLPVEITIEPRAVADRSPRLTAEVYVGREFNAVHRSTLINALGYPRKLSATVYQIVAEGIHPRLHYRFSVPRVFRHRFERFNIYHCRHHYGHRIDISHLVAVCRGGSGRDSNAQGTVGSGVYSRQRGGERRVVIAVECYKIVSSAKGRILGLVHLGGVCQRAKENVCHRQRRCRVRETPPHHIRQEYRLFRHRSPKSLFQIPMQAY